MPTVDISQPLLTLPHHHIEALSSYLPPPRSTFLSEPSSSSTSHPTTSSPSINTSVPLPWVTLTYATSLDSRISIAPGVRTALSGPETKAMTHFLRANHDAILVGVGTAEADDPGLDCRFDVGSWEEGKEKGREGNGDLERKERGLERQPRPFVLDPSGRWRLETCPKLFKNAESKKGRAPWWIVSEGVSVNELKKDTNLDQNPREELQDRNDGEVTQPSRLSSLYSVNGRVLHAGSYHSAEKGVEWEKTLRAMGATGVRSVMIEGGARVINDLLRGENQWMIKSVVVTVAPIYLGKSGVEVAPNLEGQKALRLKGVKWLGMGSDIVMAGFLEGET